MEAAKLQHQPPPKPHHSQPPPPSRREGEQQPNHNHLPENPHCPRHAQPPPPSPPPPLSPPSSPPPPAPSRPAPSRPAPSPPPRTRSAEPAAAAAAASDTLAADATPYVVPPPTRYQLLFPRAVEQCFARFDDAIIALCQRRTTGLVLAFSTTFTFFTSIEVSLVAPPALYALGYDTAAGLCASVLLVLGVVSQVPKKFIFRPRPWMVNRAVPIRRDKTSSFPSRAVVCAVVFCWLFAWSVTLERNVARQPIPATITTATPTLTAVISPLLLWPCIVCVAALTAFARINVGAHYPSDTVLGFVLGCIVVNLGSRLELVWHSVCDLTPAAHYAPSTPPVAPWRAVAQLLAALPFWAVTVAAYAATLVSIQGFWVKCSYVYGLLLSAAAFRATHVCMRSPPTLARVLLHGPLSTHVRATAPFAMLLIFGMLLRGKKGGAFRIMAFTLIYLGSLLAMMSWRLWSEGPIEVAMAVAEELR